jgi:hypothetical protein
VIDLDVGIDVDNLINSIDPIGAPFDPSTPNTVVEVPTSIICNPNRSPRDKSIRDMVNNEDEFFDDGYDSDGGKWVHFITELIKKDLSYSMKMMMMV